MLVLMTVHLNWIWNSKPNLKVDLKIKKNEKKKKKTPLGPKPPIRPTKPYCHRAAQPFSLPRAAHLPWRAHPLACGSLWSAPSQASFFSQQNRMHRATTFSGDSANPSGRASIDSLLTGLPSARGPRLSVAPSLFMDHGGINRTPW
jgi:hypothetical protein